MIRLAILVEVNITFVLLFTLTEVLPLGSICQQLDYPNSVSNSCKILLLFKAVPCYFAEPFQAQLKNGFNFQQDIKVKRCGFLP